MLSQAMIGRAAPLGLLSGADLGFIKKAIRKAQRVAKKVTPKVVQRGVTAVAKTVTRMTPDFIKDNINRAVNLVDQGARFTAALALAPFKFLVQFGIRLGKIVCGLPPVILQQGAQLANVNPDVVPLFCQALKTKKFGDIKRLLPPIIKMSVKLAAVGAVPGLGPVLATLRFVPGLNKFLGAEEAAAGVAPDLYDLDELSVAQIGAFVEAMDDDEIAEALGLNEDSARISPSPNTPLAILGLTAAGLAGYGIYLATRPGYGRRR